jgi:hypothetical protein
MNNINYKDLVNNYLSMVKALKRTRADFLCLLHHCLINSSTTIEHDGLVWTPKTFEEWATDLELSDRVTNRTVTSLRQENIILTEKRASHRTICTNYYTINYPEFWRMVPEARELFTPLHKGEVA